MNIICYKLETVISEHMGNVGIYTFYNELVAEHDDEIKLLLVTRYVPCCTRCQAGNNNEFDIKET